ncbi:MAG: response regulator transcription factor [Chloroflexi bacterium]|nr:response regulator transcription factor [Chloroflexota bacterium]
MSQETILVVDDDAALVRGLTLTLQAEGYQVLTASDGLKALSLLESSHIDLIIADVAMPKMNGYQLLERVRQNPEWVAIPFLLLTGRAMDSDVRYGKELGVDDYLIKPVDPDDLLASVRGKLLRAKVLMGAVTKPVGDNEGLLEHGPIKLDLDSFQAWVDGEPVSLSVREFKLLQALLREPGKVYEHVDLVTETHEFRTDHIQAGNLLRPLMRSLRNKLNEAAGRPLDIIVTVRGVGYRLKTSEELAEDE